MTTLEYQGTELSLFARALNWKAYLAKAVRPFLGETVLEVGAGLGATTRALYDGQREWVCLEPDSGMAAQLRTAVSSAQLPPACQVVAGTTEDLIARGLEGQFASVLYIDVLEHIEDDCAELARALRLVKPGGHVVVLSPAFQWLYSPFDAAVGHFRRYSRLQLRRAAPPEGKILRLRYLDSVGFVASLANKLALRSGMPTQGQIRVWDRIMVPLSRLADPMVGYMFGRSVLAIWSR